MFRLELADPVPVRTVGAGAGGDVDITDDKAVPEPLVQDPPDAFRHLVLVQFMVARRDDVVRDVGEQVEGGRGSLGEGGSGFGVDETVAVYAVAGVDEEEVDAEGAGVLLQAVRERVEIWVSLSLRMGQGGAGRGGASELDV